MPTYDYRCLECNEIFEVIHGMNEKQDSCELCGSNKIKKLFNAVSFHVVGGTPKSSTHGYTGRHQDLVKRRKGNKDYRDGHRREIQQKEKIGLNSWREEQKMASAQSTFEKMRAEGAKMTKQEKEALKKEYGIKKK